MFQSHILCVDDDLVIFELVKSSLNQSQVSHAPNIKSAIEISNNQDIDCFLVDVNLPDGNGYRFITELQTKNKYKNTPILIFSNDVEINNKVTAFSLGADDFIEKPFDPLELRARVLSKIQKMKSNSNESFISNVKLDLNKQKAILYKNNEEIDLNLTFHEMKIMVMLSRRLEQVFSRQQILDEVWGDTYISDRTVDSHIAHLRKKISKSDLKIKTLKNIGYCLKIEKS